jgi:hypothetical protein
LVDDGVEGRVADEVVRDVDLQALMLRDGRREGVQDVGEGGKGALSKLASCVALA